MQKVTVSLSLDDLKNQVLYSSVVLVSNALLLNLGPQIIVEFSKLYSKVTFVIDCEDNFGFLLFLLKNNLKYFLFTNSLQYSNDILNINISLSNTGKVFNNFNNMLEFFAAIR